MSRTVLVCRTAWMNEYRGLLTGEAPTGGGSYVDAKGFGHEIFNFLPEGGCYFGYVRPPGKGSVANQRINITRLGADAASDRIERVTVVWVAKHPEEGGNRVVGWYEDATVWRSWRPTRSGFRVLPNGQDAGYMVEARKATLLPVDDRVFVVPRAITGQPGIGQSNVWYPDEVQSTRLTEYMAEFTAAANAPPVPRTVIGASRLMDTERRLAVEQAAMRAVAAWCEARYFEWRDVSAQNLGWDIEATAGQSMLRIEVKGTSMALGAALLELTPNEYAKMCDPAIRPTFRLAVASVKDANAPDLKVFAWSPESCRWVADGGFAVRLHEVRSARVEVTQGDG